MILSWIYIIKLYNTRQWSYYLILYKHFKSENITQASLCQAHTHKKILPVYIIYRMITLAKVYLTSILIMQCFVTCRVKIQYPMLLNKPLQGKYFLEHSIKNLSNKSTTKLKVIDEHKCEHSMFITQFRIMAHKLFTIFYRLWSYISLSYQ